MSYLMDFWHAIVAVYTAADLITLAIMLVIVLGAGWIMERFNALIATTTAALLLFAVAGFVRAVVVAHGHDTGALAGKEWQAFLALKMQTLLVYAVSFALVISIVHAIRQIVNAR